MKLKSLRTNHTRSLFHLVFAALLALSAGGALPIFSQQISGYERERGRMMLKIVKDDLKDHYYDPTFHGMNLDESFQVAEEKIKQATTNSQIFAIIAQTLMALNDSHTFFLPPMRGFRVEYGWQMQAYGDKCYVTVIKPGSDAEAKGLKPGDIIQKIDGFNPTRENLWILNYLFRALSPRSTQQLIVQSPGGQPRQLEIASKVHEGQKLLDLTNSAQFHDFIIHLQGEDYLYRDRFKDFGNDLLIWKMQQFVLTEKEVEGVMGKVKGYKNVILDLRGNGGGYVETMRHLVGYFLGKEVKIADLKTRKDSKPLVSKKAGGYEGNLIVLVDSNSASASEIFARMMQLEKRATIIGDKSSGSVMESVQYSRALGTDSVVFYGTSITEADVIMPDGKSLEHVGVTPDELLLPTAEDLAAKRDPVLAHAAELLGVKLDPEKAGALFPVEWPR